MASEEEILGGCALAPEDYELDPNEKALKMLEVEGYDDEDGHIYRYQYTWFVRNDQAYVHKRKLGLSYQFPCPPINVPNCWVSDGGRVEMFHTVRELQEIMAQARTIPDPELQIEPTDYGLLIAKRAELEREIAQGIVGASTRLTRRFLT